MQVKASGWPDRRGHTLEFHGAGADGGPVGAPEPHDDAVAGDLGDVPEDAVLQGDRADAA